MERSSLLPGVASKTEADWLVPVALSSPLGQVAIDGSSPSARASSAHLSSMDGHASEDVFQRRAAFGEDGDFVDITTIRGAQGFSEESTTDPSVVGTLRRQGARRDKAPEPPPRLSSQPAQLGLSSQSAQPIAMVASPLFTGQRAEVINGLFSAQQELNTALQTEKDKGVLFRAGYLDGAQLFLTALQALRNACENPQLITAEWKSALANFYQAYNALSNWYLDNGIFSNTESNQHNFANSFFGTASDFFEPGGLAPVNIKRKLDAMNPSLPASAPPPLPHPPPRLSPRNAPAHVLPTASPHDSEDDLELTLDQLAQFSPPQQQALAEDHYTEVTRTASDPVRSAPGFWQSVSADRSAIIGEVENLLSSKPEGTYLLRASTSQLSGDSYALSFKGAVRPGSRVIHHINVNAKGDFTHPSRPAVYPVLTPENVTKLLCDGYSGYLSAQFKTARPHNIP